MMTDLKEKDETSNVQSVKRVPDGASQHITAGPYSPVIVVDRGSLVVISGQVAVDLQGNIVGDTIEAQSRQTLHNCLQQLQTADCSFADVFKVNVYLKDLEQWPRFNEVYVELIPSPLPVRTAIGAALLPGLLVEIEMWAAKHS